MDRKIVLKMTDITKRFHSVTALKDVSIDLYENEIIALVGENGAGKSTLMKILSGSYTTNEYDGTIKLAGEVKKFSHTSDAENAGIEMIYQEISLMRDMTVAENVMLGRMPQKKIKGFVDWKKTREIAQRALDLVELDISLDTLVRRLSTSQMQLLSIGKALMRDPKILVLDEPTSALTESETHNLLNILRDLKERGISCIYISHKLDEVFALVDRVTILRDGHVISTYDNHEQIDTGKVIEDMVGRKVENMYPKIHVDIGDEMLRVEDFTVASPVPSINYVENESFSVNAGEILGIGGLVGSGRSEFLNAVFGAIPKISGKVFIEGNEISIKSPRDAINHKIGLVTEDRKESGFVGTMSLRENISLASFDQISKNGWLNKKYEIERTQEQFDALRIKAPSIETNVLNLSGGNQQKVVLSKWLMSDVKVLFLDEPTRGIDIGAKVEIYNIMFELAKKGVAIVVISSELPELMAISDKFAILSQGHIRGRFSRDEMTEEKFMKAATSML
jgi:ABC-type sugar transport system ATPase subunit